MGGGTVSSAHAAPFIANIKRSGSLMCGGSLVAPGYVVSAAHCEYNIPSRLTVTVGDVTLANLPTPNVDVAVGTECTVYGWGTTSSGGSISNSLRQVTVPVISNDDCDTYPYYR